MAHNPSVHNNATSAGRVTRAASRQTSQLPTDKPPTRQELIDTVLQASPKNITQARAFLSKNGFLSNEDAPTYEALSYALLSMAFSAPEKILQDGARAVAIAMMDLVAVTLADDVTCCIEKQLQPIAESLTIITEELQKTAENTKQALAQMQHSAQVEREAQRQEQERTQGFNTLTYATALKGQVPMTHQTTITRARTRNCQLLIDDEDPAISNPLKNLTEQELVAKANEALDLSKDQNTPTDGKFLGAKKLNNGGIVFDLNTAQITSWVKNNKKTFTDKFGAMAVIKDRAVTVIVEFVPVEHRPDALAECRKVERDSGLPEHSLLSTRWFKDPNNRKEGQRVAHLLARFNDTTAANIAIRDGLIIAGKRTWARKLKKEPRRCLKCQRLDVKHLAAECDGKETCGTCGEEHRTQSYTEGNTGKVYCVNCKSNDHASWNRYCPKFTQLADKLEKQDTDSTYKYFPNDEAWTWEQQYQEANETQNNTHAREHQNNNNYRAENQHAEEPQFDRWADNTRNYTTGERGGGSSGSQRINPPIGVSDRGWNTSQNRRLRQTQIDQEFDRIATGNVGPSNNTQLT